MFKKYLLPSLLIICILFGLSLIISNQALALDIKDNLENAGGASGAQFNTAVQGTENAIPNTIGQIVAIVLSFVGSIFLILTVYSGLQWMTAGGNEEKVKQARTRLINSIMGLVITVAAYFITYLISTTLLGT